MDQPLPTVIDPDAIRTFCSMLFGYLEGRVPVRLISEKDTPHQPPVSEFIEVNKVGKHLVTAAAAAARARRAVFVVPGSTDQAVSARAEDIRETGVILVDLDEGDIPAKRDHLVRYLGPASMEVASGGKTDLGDAKLHIYWRLSEAAHGDDLVRVAEARRLLARKVGADPSFASLHQPIRVAGTAHGKAGKLTPVRILLRNEREYDLGELSDAISAMPPLAEVHYQDDLGEFGRHAPSTGDLSLLPIHAGSRDVITRFDAVSRVIGHWIRNARVGRCSIHEAWEAVADHNEAMIRPPWDTGRLRREFEALLRKDINETGPLPTRPAAGDSVSGVASDGALALSEDGLADRFASHHAETWKHVTLWGQWYQWTGTHWRRDETSAAQELTRMVCRAAATQAGKTREAARIASLRTITSVQRIAAGDARIALPTEAFDQYPMLLNTPGGVIDLSTGEDSPHQPSLLITQINAVATSSSCPRWLSFLDEVTAGDVDLQGYLRRLAGYCLTGRTDEQVFFFLFGSGANGKSVFTQTIASVLGAYAATAAADTFSASGINRHLTALAGLRASRLVIVSETEADEAWAEARIKAVTGGEKIRANFMHKDHFEFAPGFKLIISGNHRPRLSGAGEAMRRRLHVVPFSVTIPIERRDPRLSEALQEESGGILSWMIGGCREWQQRGLAPPSAVLDAARDYFDDEDLIGRWIADRCDLGTSHRASSSMLFADWAEWTTSHGFDKRNGRYLGEQLRSRGLRQAKVGQVRGWHGIGLRGRRPGGAP